MLRAALAFVLGLVAVAVGPATAASQFPAAVVFADARVAGLAEDVAARRFEAADRALRAGVNVNAAGRDGETLLAWMIATEAPQGRFDGVAFLLDHGANPNVRDAEHGRSALALAAGGDRPALLELLLQHHGDANLPGPAGESLLDIAIDELRLKNVALLLRFGADPNAASDLGFAGATTTVSAAEHAAQLNQFDIVDLLLAHGYSHELQKLADIIAASRTNPSASERKRSTLDLLAQRGVRPRVPLYVPGS